VDQLDRRLKPAIRLQDLKIGTVGIGSRGDCSTGRRKPPANPAGLSNEHCSPMAAWTLCVGSGIATLRDCRPASVL